MNISGAPLVVTPHKPEETLLALRVNQRIAAEVLHVDGDQVTLAYQGMRFVARLTAPDQNALLAEHRLARFVVRDLSGGQVGLQLAPGVGAPAGASASGALVSPELAQRLLAGQGLPAKPENLQLAQQLMNQGLPVSPQTLSELRESLASLGWRGDPQTAALAAWLKAEGLPITPGSLEMARAFQQQGPALAGALLNLRDQLAQALGGRLPEPAASLANQALQWIDRWILDPSAGPEALARQLRDAIAQLSQPLERALAGDQDAGSGLLLLAQLRAALARSGPAALRQALDAFLDSARWGQFANLPPETQPPRGDWLAFQLPVQASGSRPGEAEETQIRIACRSDGPERVEAGYTRLVIQVDLPGGEGIEVDLSVVQRSMGALVTASSEPVRQLAESELDSLQDSLARLGYQLRSVRCAQAETAQPTALAARRKVNLSA